MQKLYEVIIGEIKQTPVAEIAATETTPAVPASVTTEDVERVDLKNVVGQSVEEVVEKVKPTLAAGQYIGSVTKLSVIHA